MSWRTVVVTNSAKLDYQLGYLVIRRTDVVKVHISEISILIIESTSVSLTAALLCELIKKKIKVIFCDEKRNPCSELVSYYGSHDDSDKIRKQVKWDDSFKKVIWTLIVKEKIKKQAELLNKLGLIEANKLYGYFNEVQLNDQTNREGHAAKVYFNSLFGKDFSRDLENNINAALNYGYAIILSMFNREIVTNGYLTQIGVKHDNMFNHFNLSCDLMEPFRPLVDELVLSLDLNKFEHDEKMKVLKVLQKEVIIGGRKETTSNAIKIYCRSILEALNEQDTSLIKFYKNEL